MPERLEDRTVPSSVSGLSITSGPAAGGTMLQVNGSGFTGANVVSFGGANVSYYSFEVVNDGEIALTPPPAHAAGTVDVTVTTDNGTSATTADDQYTYVATATTTTLASSADPSTFGQTITLTVTVSNGGPVPRPGR